MGSTMGTGQGWQVKLGKARQAPHCHVHTGEVKAKLQAGRVMGCGTRYAGRQAGMACLWGHRGKGHSNK